MIHQNLLHELKTFLQLYKLYNVDTNEIVHDDEFIRKSCITETNSIGHGWYYSALSQDFCGIQIILTN